MGSLSFETVLYRHTVLGPRTSEFPVRGCRSGQLQLLIRRYMQLTHTNSSNSYIVI